MPASPIFCCDVTFRMRRMSTMRARMNGACDLHFERIDGLRQRGDGFRRRRTFG